MNAVKCQLEPCDHQEKYDDELLKRNAEQLLKCSVIGKVYVLCAVFKQKIDAVLRDFQASNPEYFLDVVNMNIHHEYHQNDPEKALGIVRESWRIDAMFYAFGKEILEDEGFEFDDLENVRRRIELCRASEEAHNIRDLKSGSVTPAKIVQNMAVFVFLNALLRGTVVVGDEQNLTHIRETFELPDPTLEEVLAEAS
ncbi:MAG: hypothetical protein AAB588_04725 [Patescibacteria group bacterium]